MALKPMFDQHFSSWNETEELEAYNRDFNERMAKRPVGNKTTCKKCDGKGFEKITFLNSFSLSPNLFADYHDKYRCLNCNGTGYVTPTT